MQGGWGSCKPLRRGCGDAGDGVSAVALPRVTFQKGKEIHPSLFFHPPSAPRRDGGGSGCAAARQNSSLDNFPPASRPGRAHFHRPLLPNTGLGLPQPTQANSGVSARSFGAEEIQGLAGLSNNVLKPWWPCPLQISPGLCEPGCALLPHPGVLLQEGS